MLFKWFVALLFPFLLVTSTTASDLAKWRKIDHSIAETQKQKNNIYKNKERLFFKKMTENFRNKPEPSFKNKKFKIYKYIDGAGKTKFGDKKKHSGFQAFNLQKYRTRNKSSRISKGTILGYEKGKRVYGSIIKSISSNFGVSPNLVHAVIATESAYNSQAVSSAGAVGLMQLMPATATRYGVSNRRDPIQNIKGGTQYLRDLLKLFDGNLKLVAAAYNAGENAVLKYNRSIPPYKETQNYVVKVLKFYNEIEEE